MISLIPEACLKNSLYQEFFSGKGSLQIECIDLKNPIGEIFEFYEKKGKLFLKADNEKTLNLALSFLGRLKPEEALGYLGKWHPRFPVRAITLLETPERWGFNASGLTIEFSKAKEKFNRDKTLLDLTIEEMEASEAQVFYTDEASIFLELDFVPGKRWLSFHSEAIWELLMHAPPMGTPLLPKIKLEEVKEKLPKIFNRMVRHPFKGIIIETDKTPEQGSEGEKALLAAGFGSYLGVPHELWFPNVSV